MDFDLRLLAHARALAEEGSFARAARTLHLTQPALSRSIQELERRTGIRLFDRNKARVEPTDLGRLFLAHAREVLGRAEALDRELATMRGSATGSLVIGSGTFPTVTFVADAIGAFLHRNSGVGIRLVNDNWTALVAALRRRELDLVVSATPPPEELADIDSRPLAWRQGYFLVRPGHPLLMRDRLALVDIVAHPVVCTARLPADLVGRMLEARRGRHAGRSIPDVACESHEMMRRITQATDHVLLSTLAPCARALADGELALVPLVEPKIGVTFAILRLASRTLASIAKELANDVVAADRATLDTERKLAVRLLGAARGHAVPPRRRGRVA